MTFSSSPSTSRWADPSRKVQTISTCLSTSELAGKKIIITGGASGIGRDTAIQCVRAGALVVIGDLNIIGAEGTRKICDGLHDSQISTVRVGASEGQGAMKAEIGRCFSMPQPCDVTKPTSLYALFKFAQECFSSAPDVVIANAGVNELGDYLQEKKIRTELGETIKEPRMPTLDVNLKGVMLTAKAAEEVWARYPVRENSVEKRKLILLSSMAGFAGLPVAPTYGTAKHGVIGLWLSTCDRLQKEGDARQFDCHVVSPYFSLTPLLSTSTKIILAGLPLVEFSMIAGGIARLASGTAGPTASGVGSVLALPDDKDPILIPFEEFGVVEKDMYRAIENELIERSPDYASSTYKKAVLNDVLAAFGLNRIEVALKTGLIMIAIVVILRWFFTSLSKTQLFLVGFALSAALKVKAFKKAQARKNKKA